MCFTNKKNFNGIPQNNQSGRRKKMKHSEVPEALELVIEEVGKESQRIREAGIVALRDGKYKPARKAIDYAEKLQEFVEKVRKLGDEWTGLQYTIDKFTPDVQVLVRPDGNSGRDQGGATPLLHANPAEVVFPYAVGKVVQAVFPILQTDMRMTEANVAMLASKSSSARFKTGGCSVLRPNTGSPNEIIDSAGHYRYYGKLSLVFFGRKYWLTSQFQPHGIKPVLDWLAEIGLSNDDVLAICKKRWGETTMRKPILKESLQDKKGGRQTMPRQPGKYYSEEGYLHLREKGKQNRDKQKRIIDEACGSPVRLLRPITDEALIGLRTVKGFVNRTNFLSSAIISELKYNQNERPLPPGHNRHATGTRISVSKEVYEMTKDMDNRTFCLMVSRAILCALGRDLKVSSSNS